MKLIKKMLACVCALSVMACLFVGVSFTASAAYSGEGEGTELKPYLVKTAAQLKEVVKMGDDTVGKYFKMANDIAINEGTVNESSVGLTNWVKSNDGVCSFRGVFDGAGHIVSGLYFKDKTSSVTETIGLFPYVGANAIIKNVGLTNSYIATTASNEVVGSITGYTAGPNIVIENCYVDSTVKMVSDVGVGLASIITTKVTDTVDFKNCYFIAQTSNIAGNAVAEGSLFARINTNAVAKSNGFYTDKATLFSSLSQLSYTAQNTYYIGTENATYKSKGASNVASVADIKGDAAKTNMSGLDWTDAFKTVDNGLPMLKAFTRSTITFDQSAVGGSEVINPIVVPVAETDIPAAPAGFHWMNGETLVKDKITTDVDVTLVATACSGGTATCQTKAECATCGEEYGFVSDKHNTELKNVKAATCREKGYSGDEVCKDCNQTIKDGSETPISTTHSDTSVIDAKEATCEAEGYTGDEVCFTCDTVVKKGEAIAKKAHTMVDGKCTVCGVSETVASAPQTGEGSTAILWLTILGLNAVAAVLLFACKKRMGAAE